MHPSRTPTAVGLAFAVQEPYLGARVVAHGEQRIETVGHQIYTKGHSRADARRVRPQSMSLWSRGVGRSPCLSLQLQNKYDPNIANVSADHPFISATPLEAEGMKLLESVITMLYTSQ